MTDTPRWHILHRSLHWVMALAIIAMLLMGAIMTDMADGPVKLKIYALHKSIGFTLLLLLLLRLSLRLLIARPPESVHGWQKAAALGGHIGLYGLMLGMPLSGWLLNSAANFPLNWFGWLSIPSIAAADETAKLFYRDIHEIFAWILTGLIALHALAALQHHCFKKDGVLQAMLPSRTGALLLALLVASFLYAGYRYINSSATVARDRASDVVNIEANTAAAATIGAGSPWQVSAESHLRFIGTYDDVEFQGEFPFIADIRFNPQSPETGSIKVEIDVTGVDSQSTDRDSALAESEWFDFLQYPKAQFTASNMLALGNNRFQAQAQLTIRDITRRFDYQFVWIEKDGVVSYSSDTSLNRLDYDIGTGLWVDEIVGHTVRVQTYLNLTKP